MSGYLTKREQAGLTLVELMVAIVLSMLLMLGVIQIFLGSKATYVSNQELSQVQESGRFAVELLSRDIRNAGYTGQCFGQVESHVAGGKFWSRAEGAILGWKEGEAPDFVGAGEAEGLFVQFAVGDGVGFEGASTNTATNPEINWSAGVSSSLKANEIAVIADGLGCDLFKVAAIADNSITKDGAGEWSHDYQSNFEILGFSSVAYYVKDDGGTPTLFRTYFSDHGLSSKNSHALVAGVESIKLEYGISNNQADLGKVAIKEYVAADEVTNWESVLAVRLILNVKSSSGLEKEFSTLVGLRNRLP